MKNELNGLTMDEAFEVFYSMNESYLKGSDESKVLVEYKEAFKLFFLTGTSVGAYAAKTEALTKPLSCATTAS